MPCMTREDDIGPSPRKYLIGGEDGCAHETHFLGSDIASNQYYRCDRCGGSIIVEGGNQYERQETDSADLAAFETLVDPSVSKGSKHSVVARLRSFFDR